MNRHGLSPRAIPAVMFDDQARIPREYWAWINLLFEIRQLPRPITAWPLDRSEKHRNDRDAIVFVRGKP